MCVDRNGYSLYCAELMVNMKDVPSTERMVLCSKQWKMMTQKEKDMFQKRCEQVTLGRRPHANIIREHVRTPPITPNTCTMCYSNSFPDM